MTINDMKEIFERCEIKNANMLSENITFKDLGVDSLDLSVIKYEVSSLAGKDIKIQSSDTVGDVLALTEG